MARVTYLNVDGLEVPCPELASSSSEACMRDGIHLQNRWKTYCGRLATAMPKLVESIPSHVVDVVVKECGLQTEAEHLTRYGDQKPKSSNIEEFWKIMMYRPDVSEMVYMVLKERSPDAASLLKGAVELASFHRECWCASLPSIPESKWTHIMATIADALSGVATYSMESMEQASLISIEQSQYIRQQGEDFSAERGEALYKCLATVDPHIVISYFVLNKNAFILSAITSVFNGHWRRLAVTLPNLPFIFMERPTFQEPLKRLVRGAFCSHDQCWIVIHGPCGTGKTTVAMTTAHEMPEVCQIVWLHFGDRNVFDIWHDAQMTLSKAMHQKVQYDANQFLLQHLTPTKTRYMALLIDDVCDLSHLEPFKQTHLAIITSRRKLAPNFVTNVFTMRVPLSLYRSEALSLFKKISSKRLGRSVNTKAVEKVMNNVSYQMLSVASLAAMLKGEIDYLNNMASTSENPPVEQTITSPFILSCLSPSEINQTADSLSTEIDDQFFTCKIEGASEEPSEVDYDETEDTDDQQQINVHVPEDIVFKKIYSVLELIVSHFTPEQVVALESLVVFPRSTLISIQPFAKFHKASEEEARKILDFFYSRCILQKREDKYLMHDLYRDVLDKRFEEGTMDQQNFFKTLVESYDITQAENVDPNDSYFYVQFLSSCIEANDVERARQLLTSGAFLVQRLLHYGQLNVISDFNKLTDLGVPIADLVEPRALAFTPNLWHTDLSQTNLFRQILLFDRGSLNAELHRLAKNVTELPLWRLREQTRVTRSDGFFRQTSHTSLSNASVTCLTWSSDNLGLIATDNGDLVVFDEEMKVVHSRSCVHAIRISETVLKNWLVVTKRSCILLSPLLEIIDIIEFEGDIHMVDKHTKNFSISSSGRNVVFYLQTETLQLVRVVNRKLEWKQVEGILSNDNKLWNLKNLAIGDEVIVASISKRKNIEIISENPTVTKKSNTKAKQRLVVYDIEQGVIVQSMVYKIKGIFCILPENQLAYCVNKVFTIFDWKNNSVVTEIEINSFGDRVSYDGKHFSCSPDGRLIALLCEGEFNGVLVFDLSTKQQIFRHRNATAVVLLDKTMILGFGSGTVSLFKPTEQAFEETFWRATIEECKAVVWFPAEEDFVLFYANGLDLEGITSRERKSLFKYPVAGGTWSLRVCACSTRVAFWRNLGQTLYLTTLSDGSTEELDVEEGILDVACGPHILFVVTFDKTLATWEASSDGEMNILRTPKVPKVMAMDSHVVIMTRDVADSGHIEVWDSGNTVTFSLQHIHSFVVSPTYNSFAVLNRHDVYEYSPDGTVLRQFNNVSEHLLQQIHFLPDEAIFVNDFIQHAYICSQEFGIQSLHSNAHALAYDEKFFYFLTEEECWMMDRTTGTRELVINAKNGLNKDVWELQEILLDPKGDKLILRQSKGAVLLSQIVEEA